MIKKMYVSVYWISLISLLLFVSLMLIKEQKNERKITYCYWPNNLL